MQAVIIAGGLGSRLWPLTVRHPKHLLPVANVAFLVHQLARLARAGVDHVVLATSYRAEAFARVLGDGSALGLRLNYTTEASPLGTGGAARAALDSLDPAGDDPVLVLNGDQLSDHDLAAQVAGFRAAGADLSLQLIEVADARAYGCVPTDSAGWVTEFLEKSPEPVGRQVNAGCYVFARHVLAAIPADRVVSLERDTFPGLLREGRRVVGHRHAGYWLDVGTPETLVRASADLVRGLVRSPALLPRAGSRLVHPTAEVSASARVVGGTAVGPGAAVAADALVDGSLLMAGATVAAGARLVSSVLGPGARVGPGTVLDGVVLGDGAAVGAGCELRGGMRIACDVSLPDGSVRFSAAG